MKGGEGGEAGPLEGGKGINKRTEEGAKKEGGGNQWFLLNVPLFKKAQEEGWGFCQGDRRGGEEQ